MEYVHGVESAHDGHLNAGHGRNQNARMLKVAYGPTDNNVSPFQYSCNRGGYALLQSSTHHHVQAACCASRDMHHLHHDGSHIPQRRI